MLQILHSAAMKCSSCEQQILKCYCLSDAVNSPFVNKQGENPESTWSSLLWPVVFIVWNRHGSNWLSYVSSHWFNVHKWWVNSQVSKFNQEQERERVKGFHKDGRHKGLFTVKQGSNMCILKNIYTGLSDESWEKEKIKHPNSTKIYLTMHSL